jgi:hypothetical protein
MKQIESEPLFAENVLNLKKFRYKNFLQLNFVASEKYQTI